jgi:pyruvate formate lyase activating enzyme
VADWVCPGGSECGYPEFSYSIGPEYGFKNLAVFCCGCSFNCLFCQNWHFKEDLKNRNPISVSALANAIDSKTSCVCFFGGDPTPQLPYAFNASKLARKHRGENILRICWETNGSMKMPFLKKMVNLSMESGGCIKFDLKSWNEKLHLALCGVSNCQTLKNFAWVAEQTVSRREPPLLIASTLLIPGYINEEEIYNLARFIASFDPDIPYSLLGFYPHFFMNDLPLTSRNLAEKCLQAATDAGLRRVKIGNIHLLKAE